MSTVILALIFAYTNGVLDASPRVATMVASRAASPSSAVIYAATLGLIGSILGGSAVAFTMMQVIDVEPSPTLGRMMLAALMGATLWNIITWRKGLPSSSTHSLVGGLVGAAAAGAGMGSISWGIEELVHGQVVGLSRIVLLLILSVAAGFIGGYVLRKVTAIVLRPANRTVTKHLLNTQWFTTGVLAFAHGSNDSQKLMGIIVLALMSANLVSTNDIPLWVRISCALVLSAGTLAGGWNIMKTLGRKIYPLRALDSLNSQITSASTLLISTIAGAPVSSAQVVTSSIMGVGAAENAKMVQWSVGKPMIVSWFLTIPASATISALILLIMNISI